jgi:chromosome segregation ATPase
MSEVSSAKLKRFLLNLASASKAVNEKQQKKEEISQQLSALKGVSKGKKSEIAINLLEKNLKEILEGEKKLLRSQSTESKVILELKDQVQQLNEKLMGIGREYAGDVQEKEDRIKELEEQLSEAQARIVELEQEKDQRLERLAKVEDKIKSHHEEKKNKEIKQVEEKLKELEKTHKDLEKTGKHKKTDLNRLKKIITTHKKTLSDMKK